MIQLQGPTRPGQSEDEQCAFFHAALDRTLTAEAKAGIIERHFALAGFVLSLKFAGDALARCFIPALAHLEVPWTSCPDAVFHIWDSESTGTDMVPPPCPRGCFTSRGDIWTMGSPRFKSAYLWSEYALNLFDTITATGVYWTQAAEPLPYWAKASPLRCLFHWWAETRGCQLVHAAAVGREGRAVLITGKGGLGKSTTALSCLGKGLDYIGDDYVVVQLDPVPRVHSLYCTAKLNWDQMARFPRLADLAIGHGSGSDKAVMYLYPEMQGQIARSLPLHTIVTPRISNQPQAELGSISAIDMQRAIAATTMSQLPRAGEHTYQFINRLVARLPAFQLIVGTNLDAIAEITVRLLATPASPSNATSREKHTDLPLISVIIPVHNEAQFLPDAVASVLAQNYPAIEIIVVEIGSSDDTEKAINQLPIPVLFLKRRNSGRAAALNRGIRESSGKLITFLDVDTRWPEGNLQMMLEPLLDDESCDVVQGFGKMATATGDSSHVEKSPDYITAAVYRREAFRTAGLFDQELGFGEDRDWYARARHIGLKIRQVNRVMLMQCHATDAGRGKSLKELNSLRAFKNALDRGRAGDSLRLKDGTSSACGQALGGWPMSATDFRSKLNARFKRWYHPDREPRLAFLAGLVNKSAMYPYVIGKGLDLPKRYADVASLDEIDFAALPSRLVTKPSNASVSAGVMLFTDDMELFSGNRVPITSRAAYAREKLASVREKCINGELRIIIEEFVQDCDPAYAIPRDFKVYVAGGKAHIIQVINRNGSKKSWSNSFYSRDWEFIDQEVQSGYLQGPRTERPERLDDLLEAADLIAADLQCFYRLDFYMAARGPVFGEFTSYPFGGKGFTPFGERLMCDLMDDYPDAI